DVAGTSEPNSAVTLSLDGVALASGVTDATGHWTISIGVSMGMHTVTVRASDAAGNVSPVSAPVGFTVDTSVLDTFIASGPSGLVASATAAFTFTSNLGSSFECSIDGAPFSACSTPDTFLLPDGSHTFAVRAVDSVGRVDATPAQRSWTIDTTPPAAPVVTTPQIGDTVGSATPTIRGTAEPGSTVTVTIDGVASTTTA